MSQQELPPLLPPHPPDKKMVGHLEKYFLDMSFFFNRVRRYFIDDNLTFTRGRRGRDRMVVEFTTTYAISAYQHCCCEFESISFRARCTTLCDQVWQWLATGWWFSPGTPISFTNKTDRHDIIEILLKVALNNIKQKSKQTFTIMFTLATVSVL